MARNSSPLKFTASPRRSWVTIWTYSSVCRPGVAYDMPSASMTGACDGPTPSVTRPADPMAIAAAAVRLAWNTG